MPMSNDDKQLLATCLGAEISNQRRDGDRRPTEELALELLPQAVSVAGTVERYAKGELVIIETGPENRRVRKAVPREQAAEIKVAKEAKAKADAEAEAKARADAKAKAEQKPEAPKG